MLKFKFFLIICLELSCVHAYNQNVKFEVYKKKYTTENGLVSNTIYFTAQDSKGFMWFGSEQGLSRFDGKEFVNYSTNEGLPDNDVFYAEEDNVGRLWLSCYSNTIAYIKNGIVYTSKNDPNLIIFKDKNYYSQAKDRINKELWISTPDNLYKIDSNGSIEKIKPLDHLGLSFDNGFHYKDTFFLEKLGTIYNTISRKYINANKYFKEPINKVISDDNNLYALQNNLKIIQFGIQNDFQKELGSISNFSHFELEPDGFVYAIVKDLGLIKFKMREFFEKKYEIIIAENTLNQCYIDNYKNIWITTFGDGIYCLPNSRIKFMDNQSGLAFNQITAIAMHDNNLYLAYPKSFIQIFNSKSISKISLPVIQKSGKIHTLALKNESILIGSEGGIFQLDNKKLRSIYNGQTKFFQSYNDSLILIGAANSLTLLNQFTLKTKLLYESSFRITSGILFNNDLWVGTFNGLNIVQPDSTMLEFLSLKKSRITCLANASENLVFVGTNNAGVHIVYNKKIISKINPLNSNFIGDNIRKFVVDNNTNKLWAISNKGANAICFNFKNSIFTYNLKTYSTSNILPTNEVNDLQFNQDTLFFATGKGLIIANSINKNKDSIYNVYVTKIATNHTTISFPTSVKISSKNSNLKIFFSCISTNYNSEVEYRYELKGNNKIEKDITPINYLEFRNLGIGNYNLKIYARLKNSQWSSNYAELNINVTPQFWQTPWFIAISVITLLFLIYKWYQRRINQIRNEEELKTKNNKRISELKLQALKARINPHFLFNVLTSIQNFITQNNQYSAHQYLSTFSKLMRQVLNHSKNDYITIKEEINMLEQYLKLEQLRSNFSFDYNFEISPEINSNNVKIPSILVQPFVENAILHGVNGLKDKHGIINISFSIKDNQLIIVIEDNGIGININKETSLKNDETESHFLEIIHDRINELGFILDRKIELNIINLADYNKTGTRIEINLPILY